MVSYRASVSMMVKREGVLILIVVDNGLVHYIQNGNNNYFCNRLNPYCSGQWSRTIMKTTILSASVSLNPYCSGQWSRTYRMRNYTHREIRLNPYCSGQWSRTLTYWLKELKVREVLILIVVDNGLVLIFKIKKIMRISGLNPYCSGQWSRTTGNFWKPYWIYRLNPYCSGQWSRTYNYLNFYYYD